MQRWRLSCRLRRTLADADVREMLSAAFRRAALSRPTAEAQDWLETSIPRRWLTDDGVRLYDWDGAPQ